MVFHKALSLVPFFSPSSMYSQHPSDVLRKHDFGHHFYADDTQLYKSVDLPHFSQMIPSLNDCVLEVSDWMGNNKLKLNQDKIELIFISTSHKIKTIDTKSVQLGNDTVPISTSVRNLGIYLDSTLSMDHQISHLRKLCYYDLRRISQIRPYLTRETTNTIVCSLIHSRLDYCNSLLGGITEEQYHKIQQIQNHAARVVMKAPKRDHITPILKTLHWLPIKCRIEYKLATMAYQCQNEPLYPQYMKDLVTP